jgi:GNAT superfamily N-acetyltransferase
MDASTIAALDRNYRLASGEMFAAAERGESCESSDVHCVTCGYPLAEFNWAFLKLPSRTVALADDRASGPAVARSAGPGLDPAIDPAARRAIERSAERAERYFEARKFPFRFIVRRDLTAACADLLEARGHRPLPKTTPGMALMPLRPAPAPPTGLRIARVADDTALAAFAHTAFAGFGLPPSFGTKFMTRRLLESPEAALFVGSVDGAPVATAMLLATGSIAGIYWVATLDTHRRRGFAEALTWAALEAGRQLGCTVGSLQASELGRPVYERMGFVQTAEYVFYERTPESV